MWFFGSDFECESYHIPYVSACRVWDLDLVFKQGTLDLHSASCIHQQENHWTGYLGHSQSQSNLRQSLHQNNFYSIPYVLPSCLNVGCKSHEITKFKSTSCHFSCQRLLWIYTGHIWLGKGPRPQVINCATPINLQPWSNQWLQMSSGNRTSSSETRSCWLVNRNLNHLGW